MKRVRVLKNSVPPPPGFSDLNYGAVSRRVYGISSNIDRLSPLRRDLGGILSLHFILYWEFDALQL